MSGDWMCDRKFAIPSNLNSNITLRCGIQPNNDEEKDDRWYKLVSVLESCPAIPMCKQTLMI